MNSILAAGGQADMDKIEIVGVGLVATCKDTEGNIIGLLQRDGTLSR
jgi:predicted enzyme related to lactoylglutathione lyase